MKQIEKTSRLLVCLFALLIAQSIYGQQYLDLLTDTNVTDLGNNYEYTRGTAEYYIDSISTNDTAFDSEEEEEGYGFGKVESYWGSRSLMPGIQPGGNVNTALVFGKQSSGYYCNESPSDMTWGLVGPQSSSVADMGVVFAVAARPSDLNTIYAGTQASGVWKGTNSGGSWTWQCKTDGIHLPALGVSQVDVDPNDANHIFFCAGTHMHGQNYSYGTGIFESTNGGSTWTQIFAPPSSSPGVDDFRDYFVSKFVFKPGNRNIIYAITTGKFWTLVYNTTTHLWDATASSKDFFSGQPSGSRYNYLFDLEVRLNISGNSIIYVSSFVHHGFKFNPGSVASSSIHCRMWITNNEGSSWTDIALPEQSGQGPGTLSTSDCRFVAIDFSADDPGVLYAVRNQYSTIRDYYLYKSSDDGQTWTFIHSVHEDTYDAGNYVLMVSDYDADQIFVGMDVIYKIVNASSSPSYEAISHYGSSLPAMHADIRALAEFHNGGNHTLLVGHDGGMAISTNAFSGTTQGTDNYGYTNINGSGLAISQFSGFDFFPSTGFAIGGKQDNGTQKQTGSNSWQQTIGGDGGRTRICRIDEHIVFTGVNPYLFISNDYGASFSGSPYNLDTKIVQFFTTEFDPTDQTQLWIGEQNAYRYDIPNTSWYPSSPNIINPGCDNTSLAINPQNEDIVYYGTEDPAEGASTKTNCLYKSTNRGSTWTDISSNLYVTVSGTTSFACDWAHPRAIVIDPNNGNRLFIGMSDYNDNSPTNPNKGHMRVICSSNGGSSWSDMSKGLPPYPVNCLAYQEGTDDVIYAGTDMGVYRWNKSASEWVCYNKSLPLAIITELKIDYCRGKLLCSTWGRGIWKADLLPVTDAYHITSNTTWDVNTYHSFTTNVIIDSTVKLTVKGKVSFAKDKWLKISRGAQLDLHGGTLFNECGEEWGGVFIEGSPNLAQTYANQGFFRSSNSAVLRDANNGIRVYSVDGSGNIIWPKAGGGVVQAVNTTFRNNGRHIAFMAHRSPNNVSDYSFFSGCTFEVAGSASVAGGVNNNRGVMVTAWGVNGVTFSGCDFKNTNGAVNVETVDIDRGTGILCMDARLIVKDIFDADLCTTTKRGSFYDLSKGIVSYSAPHNPLSGEFKRQDFELTDIGVYLGASSDLVHHNDFNLYVPSTYYRRTHWLHDIDFKTGIAGVLTKDAAGFRIEENAFHFTHTGASFALSDAILGVVTDNIDAGFGGARVRKNDMHDLLIGYQAQNNNKSLLVTCDAHDYSLLTGMFLNPFKSTGDIPLFGSCVTQNTAADYANQFISNNKYDIYTWLNETYVVKPGESNRPRSGSYSPGTIVTSCAAEGKNPYLLDACASAPDLKDKCNIIWPWPPNQSAYVTQKTKKATILTALGNTSGWTQTQIDSANADLAIATRDMINARNDVIGAYNMGGLNDSTVNYNDSILAFLSGETDLDNRKIRVAVYYQLGMLSSAESLLSTVHSQSTDNETNYFVDYYGLLIDAAQDGRNIYQLTSGEWSTMSGIASSGTAAGESAKGLLTLVKDQYFNTYIENGTPTNANISGTVHSNISGTDYTALTVYVKDQGGSTAFSTVPNSGGVFSFVYSDIITTDNIATLYRLKVVFASGDSVYSEYGTLIQLANVSPISLNCPDQPNITGNAPVNCLGGSHTSVPVKVQDENGSFISYTAYSDGSGDFTVSGNDIYPLVNFSHQYRLAAAYTSTDSTYSSFASISTLVSSSPINLDCPPYSPPPSYPDIHGSSATSCFGNSGFTGLAIRLQNGLGFMQPYIVYTDGSGLFIFDGDSLFSSLDTSAEYRIVVDYGYGDYRYSSFASLRDLAIAPNSFTCPPRNITGYAGLNCIDSLDDIQIYLEDGSFNQVNYSVYTDAHGYFSFDWDDLNNSDADFDAQYRLVALIPDNTMYTNFKSINQLIFMSHHYLGCSMDKTSNDSPARNNGKPPIEPVKVTDVRLYPNPTGNFIYAGITDRSMIGKRASVSVYDIYGQLVHSWEGQLSSKLIFDLSGKSDGIYIFKVSVPEYNLLKTNRILKVRN